MSKIQLNKGDLRKIVESTVRAIINENGANRFINEGYGREFDNLSEAYKSSKIRNIMNQNGGAKNRYDQPDDPDLTDKRVTQDGMGDITDEDIVYLQEYDDVNTAIKQARKLNRNDGRKVHYTVYIAKNGKGIVVGIDKDKVEFGNTWGGESTKKLADRIRNNGWNFKTRSNRYVDDSDTYYTAPSGPSKDFGYRTNHDYQNMLKNLKDNERHYEEQPYKDAMRDAKFDKNPKSAAKKVERDKENLLQKGRDNFKDWRKKSAESARDYVKHHYPKFK